MPEMELLNDNRLEKALRLKKKKSIELNMVSFRGYKLTITNYLSV